MTRLPLKLTVLATTCAVAGAGASAIISASAARPTATAAKAGSGQRPAGQRRGLRPLRRAVHADLTVPTKAGFAQVTVDRGFVKSVSGDRLTLSESTRRLTGKTVTLTIPSGARVFDNRRATTLGDVRPGQHVAVMKLPKRTVVRAHDRR